MIDPSLFRYLASGIAISLAALGTGIGQSLAGIGAIDAATRQAFGSDKSFRAMMVGLALTETAGILTLVIVIFLLGLAPAKTLGSGIAELGIGLSMGITAAAVSYASSMIVKNSCKSIARQPFFAQKILTFMLLVQSIVEAPLIFTFLVCLIIMGKASDPISTYKGVMLFCAAMVCALGSIGPAIGQSFFASAAAKSIGLNKRAYSKIFPFTLLNQAIIETPVIFSLLLALVLLFKSPSESKPLMSTLAAVASIIAMGIGSTGTGVATGRVASQACLKIARNPDLYGKIFRTSLLAQGLIESTVIYCLIIAIIIVNWF